MKKVITLMSVCLLVLCLGVGLTACGKGDDTPTDLAVPTVTVNAAKASVSWAAVANAKDYTVKIGSAEITVTATKFEFAGKYRAGVYTIQVRANSNNEERYNSSAYSASQNVYLSISYFGGVVSWIEWINSELNYEWNIYSFGEEFTPSETGIVASCPTEVLTPEAMSGSVTSTSATTADSGVLTLAEGWYAFVVVDNNDDDGLYYVFQFVE